MERDEGVSYHALGDDGALAMGGDQPAVHAKSRMSRFVPRSRLSKLLVAAFGLVALVAIIAGVVVATRPGKSDSTRNMELHSSLQAQISKSPNREITLDGALLGSAMGKLIRGTFGEHIAIVNTQLAGEPQDQQVLTGSTKIFGVDMPIKSTLQYIDGKLSTRINVDPDPGFTPTMIEKVGRMKSAPPLAWGKTSIVVANPNGKDYVGVEGALPASGNPGIAPIARLIIDEEDNQSSVPIPAMFRNMRAKALHRAFKLADSASTSASASASASASTASSASSSSSSSSSSSALDNSASLPFSGTLLPAWDVAGNCPNGIQLAAHVIVRDCNVKIDSAKQDTFNVLGKGHFAFPGNDEIVVSINGVSTSNGLVIETPFAQDWKILKRDDLVCSDALFKYSSIGLSESAQLSGSVKMRGMPFHLSSDLHRDSEAFIATLAADTSVASSMGLPQFLGANNVPAKIAQSVISNFVLVVSSRDQNQLMINMPSGDSRTVNLEAGLSFAADFKISEIEEITTITNAAQDPQSRNPVDFLVTGLIFTSGSFRIDASLTNLELSTGVVISDVLMQIISADNVATFGVKGTAKIDVAPAATDSDANSITIACSAAVQGSQFAFIGSMTGLWKPAAFAGVALSDVQVKLSIDRSNAQSPLAKGLLSGVVTVGKQTLTATISLDTTATSGRDQIALVAAMDGALDLHTMPGFDGAMTLPQLTVESATFIISSFVGEVSLAGIGNAPAQTVSVNMGLTAYARLAIGQSDISVSSLGSLGVSGDLLLRLDFADATDDLTVLAQLTKLTLPLGVSIDNAMLQISSKSPHIIVGGSVTIAPPTADGSPLAIKVTGLYSADSAWGFQGVTLEEWTITPGAGSTTVSVQNISLTVSTQNSTDISSYRATVLGAAKVAGFDLGLSLDLPISSDVSKGYHFHAECPPDFLHFGKVTVNSCSLAIQSVQPNLAIALGVTIKAGETSDPVTASIAGAFSANGDIDVSGSVSAWQPLGSDNGAFQLSDINVHFKRANQVESLDMGATIQLGALTLPVLVNAGSDEPLVIAAFPAATIPFSSLPGVNNDDLSAAIKLQDTVIVVASQNTTFSCPAANGHPAVASMPVVRGVNFQATVTFDKSAAPEIAAVATLAGNGLSVVFSGFVSTSGDWAAQAAINNIQVSSGITLNTVALKLASAVPHLSLHGHASVTLSSEDAFAVDTLVTVSGSKAAFIGTMDGQWHIAGINVENAKLTLNVDTSSGSSSVDGAIEGQANIIGIEMVAQLKVPSAIGPQGYSFIVYPPNGFALNQLPLMSGVPSGFRIDKAMFAVSTYTGDLDLSGLPNPPATSMHVGQGLNFFAVLDLASDSTVPEMVTLKQFLTAASNDPNAPLPTVTISALVSSTSSYAISGTIANLVIGFGSGSSVTMESVELQLIGASSGTSFGLTGVIQVDVPHQTDNLMFDVKGTITGSDWSFSAQSSGTWTIPVGSKSFTASELQLTLSKTEQKLHGKLDIGGFVVVISAAFPLSAESRIELDGNCPPEFPVGKNLKLESCAIVITNDYYAIQAAAVLKLGSTEVLHFDVNGRFGPDFVSVAGALQSAWTPVGTSLISVLAGQANFNYTTVNSQVVTAVFAGELNVDSGAASLAFAVDIGSADLSQGYVIVGYASTQSGETTALSAVVPRLTGSDGAAKNILVSHAAVVYASKDVPAWTSPAVPEIPQFSMDLVAGINFRGDFAIQSSNVPQMQTLSKLASTSAPLPTSAQLAGFIAETGDFYLSATLNNVKLAAGVVLNNLALSLNYSSASSGLVYSATGALSVDLGTDNNYNAAIQATFTDSNIDFVGSLNGNLQVGSITLTQAQVALHVLGDHNPVTYAGAIQGRMTIGSLDLVADLQFPNPIGSETTGYVFVAYPASSFAINGLPGMSSLPAISVANAIFVVSSKAGTLSLANLPAAPAPSIDVVDGINFACTIDLSGIPELTVVNALQGGSSSSPAQVLVTAAVSHDGYKVTASLNNISLGGGAVVLDNASLQLQSVAPQFALAATTSITIPQSTNVLSFEVSGSVSGSDWQMEGHTTNTWTIPVADTQMVLNDIVLKLKKDTTKDAGYSGTFHGQLTFADFVVDVDMAFPLSEAGGRMDLAGHCPADFHLGKRVVLSDCAILISTDHEPHYQLSANAIVNLPGNDPFAFSVSGSFGSQFVAVNGKMTSQQWKPFRASELLVTAAEIAYTKTGTAEHRVNTGYIAGGLQFSENTNLAFNATIIVGDGDESKFAFAAFPQASGNLPWGGSISLMGAALVFCNYEGTWVIPQTGMSINVKPIINVYAEFTLSTLPEYNTLRGIAVDPDSIPTTIKVTGWMGSNQPAGNGYSLSAAISNLQLGKSVTVKNCVIGIYSDEPKFRLDNVDVEVRLPKQTLEFTGSAVVSGSTFTVDAAMNTTWQVGNRVLQNAKVHIVHQETEPKVVGHIEATFSIGTKKPVLLRAQIDFPFPDADDPAESGFMLAAYPDQTLAINMLPNIPDDFPEIDLTDLVFILATADGSIDLHHALKVSPPSSGTHLQFREGLTFVAVVSLLDQPDLGSVKTWLGSEANTLGQIVASANLDDDHYSFFVEVSDLHLGSSVVLNDAKLVIQTVSPWFAIQALTTVSLGGTDSAQFSLAGHVGKDNWAFSASTVTPWNIALGSKTLVVNNLSLSISKPPSGSTAPFLASLNGDILFGSAHATISVDFPVPSAGLVIRGKLTADTDIAGALAPLGGGSMVDTSGGSNPIYGKMKAAQFRDAQFRIQTSPAMLQITGSMILFGNLPLRAGAAVLRTEAGDWAGAFGLALGDDFKFSSADSSLAIIDDLKMPEACFVISSAELPNFDIFLDNTNKNLRQGFIFEAKLPFKGRGLEMVTKWTGITSAVVRAEFLSSAQQFTLHAGVSGRFKIGDSVAITDAGLFLKINPGEVMAGLECNLEATLSDEPQDVLKFYGSIFVSPDGAGFEAAMLTPWVEPFGAKGVTVLQSAITLKLSFAMGMPTKFGIAGGLKIGQSSGELVVLANLVNFRQSMFKARLVHINVLEIVQSCTSHTIENSFAKTALNVGFEELMLYVNLASSTLEFAGQLYPPGIKAIAREVNLFGIVRGSASFELYMDKGIDLSASVMPFKIGNLLSISGATGPESNATFALTLMKGKMPKFQVSGAVTLFNAVGLSVLVDFNDAYVLADVAFHSELFNMQLKMQSVGQFPRVEDFIVDAMVNQEVLNYISEKVPPLIQEFVDHANADFDEAKAKLDAKLKGLDDKRAERDRIKAEIQQKLAPAVDALNRALEDLSRAQAKVDDLLNTIKRKEDEREAATGLKNILKRAKLSVEIAALWVAHAVASAALDVAAAAVKIAKRAISDLAPELDPRVIALNIEIGVLEAAYEAAKLLLNVAQRLVNAFGEVTMWLAKQVGTLFNVQSARISGSYKALKAGNLGTIEIHAIFLGKPVNLNLSLDISRVDRLVESVFGSIVKSITG